MSGVARFSASVDPRLLEEFDALVAGSQVNRSTAVESAMRGFIAEHKWVTEGEATLAGGIIFLYDHHHRGSVDDLTGVQHDYLDVISSTTHVHLDHANCLEIVSVKGKADRLRSLKQALESVRGVKQIKIGIVNL